MSRTMWVAVFCLVGLGLAIAIKVAAPPASLVVEPAQDQSKIEPAFALNESAKSDRLELPNARAEPGIIVPAAKLMPAETPCLWKHRACGNTVDQSGDSHEDRGPALAKCQRQHCPGRAASSASQKQRIEAKRRQIPADKKSRGLALPTGLRRQSLKVIGPLAKVPFIGRSGESHGVARIKQT